MRWLNPFALLGLGVLVLPLLIHLISRRQASVVRFPSLRFLEATRIVPARQRQLHDVPLLLLRLALLACAVVALAHPRAENQTERADSSTRVARAIIVDAAVGGTSTVRDSLTAASAASIVLETSDIGAALASASAWLATQPLRGDVVVLSDFRDGAVDSVDLAAVPRAYGLTLLAVPATATDTSRASVEGVVTTIVWQAEASAAIREAMQTIVRDAGGVPLRDAAALSAVATDSASRTIVVTSPSTTPFPADVAPLKGAWMTDALLLIARDSLLAEGARDVQQLADTTFTAPYVVVVRNAGGVPVVAMAATGAHLTVVSRAPATHVATAALLAAVSRVAQPDVPLSVARGVTTAAQRAQFTRTAADAEVAPVVRRMADRDARDRGPAWESRALWALVLLLLVGETLWRRRLEARA